ncbi:MAG: hypothetical protein M3367_11625 [Acidobacteriota bacterium]|nr:hypothetical protein [Acidobacteriota bacterium]
MEIISPAKPDKIKSFLQSDYPDYFRRDVHTLLAFGYDSIRHEINCDTEEPTITVRMAEAINIGLNTIGHLPDRLQREPYSVFPEPAEIKTKDLKNIKDEYIYFDVVFEESTRTIPRRRYTVEAKRLKTNGFSIGKYCDDGIMRFVNEVYASAYPEAAMIGFFQDKDVNYWFGELARKFKEDEKHKKMLVELNLTKINVVSQILNEWFSIHQRKSGNKILLFHIFWDCS